MGNDVYIIATEDQSTLPDDTAQDLCVACGKGHLPHTIIECERCLGGYHMGCLKPKLKQIPEVGASLLVRVNACMCLCTCVCMHVCVCMCVFMRMCISVCAYVYVRACVCICVCLCVQSNPNGEQVCTYACLQARDAPALSCNVVITRSLAVVCFIKCGHHLVGQAMLLCIGTMASCGAQLTI